MERQNSITLEGITNFLEAGALLRHRDQWILIEGPFQPATSQNSDEITVFFPDFYDLKSAPAWAGQKLYRLNTETLRANCESYLAQNSTAEVPLKKAPWEEPQKEHFAEDLRVIQERITKKEINKAVPAVFARSSQTVTAPERARMILQLLNAPTTLYIYGFWQNGEGTLGATPEVLFDYSKGLLKTMALAGTCPKSESSERDSLLKDAKEMEEHRYVTEDIVARLQEWGVVLKDGPKIVELPTLYHLKTDIQVQCKFKPDFFSLIENLHPTPALGVSPRIYGYKWMKDLPGQDGRRGFGGPFAFVGPEEALCLVAIRNLQWNREFSMIGSGCGVVAASELEREWRELFQKRLSVRKILGLEV
ncbi:chorismate-binding protein [Bdellovibrio sp. 22V]|uniref:chorismate-binding protein n=1 Tax=Bdellovibrio TaxID=958 RepID=UPI00254334FD|nr:chorismate-binding protein [Bdellovibrio sp. 22V]WII72475.1 chorismate-binding protein [Bdellovibrio sp. 22V]